MYLKPHLVESTNSGTVVPPSRITLDLVIFDENTP